MDSKAPTWQRVISGLLVLGVIWALAIGTFNGEMGSWLSMGAMLGALYGGYLFGYVALRGRLPGVLTGRHGNKSKSSAQSGGAGDA